MAGLALDRLTDRHSRVHYPNFRTIRPQVILVAGGAVASGAGGRNFCRIVFIPMDESFGGSIIVG
jgi:hypothetical protein